MFYFDNSIQNEKDIVRGRIKPHIVPLARKDLRTESKWKNNTNLLEQERCLKLSFKEMINVFIKVFKCSYKNPTNIPKSCFYFEDKKITDQTTNRNSL